MTANSAIGMWPAAAAHVLGRRLDRTVGQLGTFTEAVPKPA